MSPEVAEKLSISAPKGIVTMVVAALLGGSAGYTSSALGRGPDVVPGLTRAEVVQVASEAETRAKAHADMAAATARDDCRRDLATANTNVAATLNRLEGKVDTLATDVGALKIDVAEIKARRR